MPQSTSLKQQLNLISVYTVAQLRRLLDHSNKRLRMRAYAELHKRRNR